MPLCRSCQISLRKLVPPLTPLYTCALPTKREENWEVKKTAKAESIKTTTQPLPGQ